jgi:hypothetical protein
VGRRTSLPHQSHLVGGRADHKVFMEWMLRNPQGPGPPGIRELWNAEVGETM